MTSLLCVKKPGGSMKVHNKEIAQELISDSNITLLEESYTKNHYAKMERLACTPTTNSMVVMSTNAVNSYEPAMKKQDWLSKSTVQNLQERSDEESRAARKIYSPLLETEHTFVKGIDKFVLHEDMLKQRKRELLHKQWSDYVFEPIRRQIYKVVDGQDHSEVDRRKRELYRQYLEHVNRKGFVFLDTMDKGEYYAQALYADRPSPMRVHTPALRDPLLSQGRERNKEEQTILRCLTGSIYTHDDINQVKLPPLPLVPLGRHGTDSVQWLQMPLGHIESTPRQASRLRMKGNCTNTQVNFEEWGKLPFDPRIVDMEMMTQKKRMFPEKPPYGVPPHEVPQAPFLWVDSDQGKGACL